MSEEAVLLKAAIPAFRVMSTNLGLVLHFQRLHIHYSVHQVEATGLGSSLLLALMLLAAVVVPVVPIMILAFGLLLLFL